MTVFQRIRLLPLLVIAAFALLTMRAGEIISFLGVALAQQEVHGVQPPAEDPAAKPADDAHRTAGGEHAAAPASPASPVPVADKLAEEKDENFVWRDAGEEAVEDSPVKDALYKDLAERRQAVEKRESELARREALLKAGERELDQKMRELTAIRNEIEGLLAKQSEEEKTRVDSLVKIYEGMKAVDAARIFNTLDTDVLIQVMSKMSERKSAPILAAMNPERARTVTLLLAQQQQLPGQLPQ
jgi:flagellar motility protein MotE (MotC chaperone)